MTSSWQAGWKAQCAFERCLLGLLLACYLHAETAEAPREDKLYGLYI